MVDGLALSLSSLNPNTVNLIVPPPHPPPLALDDGDAGNQSWSPRDEKKFLKALYDFGAIHTDNFYQTLAAKIPGKTVTQVEQYFEKYLQEVHALKTMKNSGHCVRVVTQNGQTETRRRKRCTTTKAVKNHPKFRASTSNAKVEVMEVAPGRAKPRILNLFPAPPSDHVEEDDRPVTLNLFPLVPSSMNEDP